MSNQITHVVLNYLTCILGFQLTIFVFEQHTVLA